MGQCSVLCTWLEEFVEFMEKKVEFDPSEKRELTEMKQRLENISYM